MKNTEGFLDECRQGREMGFDGKTLIHPGQVAGANEAFAPSEKAVEDARGILQAWEDGRGSGVVTYNGRMVENLHVESAQRVLSMHEAITGASRPTRPERGAGLAPFDVPRLLPALHRPHVVADGLHRTQSLVTSAHVVREVSCWPA